MPTQEFWYDEPELLWTYRKSYMDKIEIENERYNQQAWLQGVYFYEAISTAIYNAFCRGKGDEAKSFTSEPYDLKANSKTLEERIQEEREKEEDIIRRNLQKGKEILHGKSR